ncbi:single-stranded DNA-binding protein [Chryseobacterium artocarpi]|uniref:Single-stranded DNA-binding protein n=1 Tax=Chryseobacterium artocarpi TaxID=1414727 RepID=A0A1B8ZC14_9FLAO|nr:single-stranded DNA-binding protein [Chryseobacterium artocarpi]OCA69140.1 single-stranded DNA-binding protein [Chryseobacterium artocarpi]
MNIVGRITKNAEVNALANDKKVVNFSVAINDSYKNKQGERVDQTTFYNCSYWISSNVAKILTKGTLVELTGKPSASAWIGKDGEIRSGLNFLTSLIKVHGGGFKSDSVIDNTSSSQPQNSKALLEDKDDDLPF